MKTYLLAIDQGSSKTIALLGDQEGTIHGIGYAGGACHASEGMDYAMNMVREACADAMTQANVTAEEVSFLVGGLTGADWEHEYKLLQNALKQALGIENVFVYNDCMIALRGGTDRTPSIVICAGTGLNAAVIGPDNEAFIYGYYINDVDMGGTALGKAAITAVFNAHVGLGSNTALTDAILSFYNLNSVDDLLFNRINKRLGLYKSLAPILFEAVQSGDTVAAQIVEDFGKSVSKYALAGLQKYAMLDKQVDVVLSGSIFKAESQLLQLTITQTLKSTAPSVSVIDALYEPVVGAFLLALDIRHGHKFPLLTKALKSSAERFGLIRLVHSDSGRI